MLARVKRLTKYLGVLQSFIILFLVYWLILPIFAVIGKWQEKLGRRTSWDKWSLNNDTIEEARHQY